MSVINTNVKSLVAQNAIEGNNNRLSTAMQRLSTGLRINSAADDAAGLAISTRMTAQVRGLNMAIKNANDGISLLQTAEGAMEEVTNMVQRIRELAVQAATDTVTDSDRADLNKEVVALQKEINRVAATTQFNGFNVLDGSFQKKVLQIGDKAGTTMGVNLKNVDAASLGGKTLIKGTQITGRVTVGDLAGNLYINGTAVQALTENNSAPGGAADPDLNDLVASINNSKLGVTASAFNEVVAQDVGSGISDAGDIAITVTALDSGEDTVITLGATTSMQDMVSQINAQGGASTVQARISDEGKLVLFNNSGATIKVVDGAGATQDTINGKDLTTTGFLAADTASATAKEFTGFMKLESDSGQNFSVEFGTAADATAMGLNKITPEGTLVGSDALDASNMTQDAWLSGSMYINGVDIWSQSLNIADAADPEDAFVKAINSFTDQTGVVAGVDSENGALTLKSIDNSPIQVRFSENWRGSADINFAEQNVGAVDYDESAPSLGFYAGGGSVGSANLLNQTSANAAIKTMDSALNQLSGYRADIGASINRLNSTVNNLSNVSTNTQASRSRILDTDYANETSELARSQIIQQAATAMLAQANQSAQTVLSLLK